ncbi:hypothetical protein BDW74DRAFT_119992 [Aspergillus multicolor]|uniref:uncharacterized protein n=1 Tax=Aspergillus multicolor TaxID=41759 RepID=UPI003CCE4DBF
MATADALALPSFTALSRYLNASSWSSSTIWPLRYAPASWNAASELAALCGSGSESACLRRSARTSLCTTLGSNAELKLCSYAN